MKAITKLYLKTFLFTGISYGIIMLGFDLAEGNDYLLWKFIFNTLFYGIIMSVTLVSYNKYRLKKNGFKEITDDNLSVSQSKTIISEMNKTELIEKLKKDPVLGKIKMQEIEDGLLLKTGINWKTWGENIKILLKSKKNSDYEYQVSSSPKMKLTLIDYGMNLENINRIETVLKNTA